MKKESIKWPVGGLWEGADFEIQLDEFGEVMHSCPHSTRHPTVEEAYICPAVVVQWNEGGNNTTGVCLYCIIDAAKANNLI